jgi:hypothetical protein
VGGYVTREGRVQPEGPHLLVAILQKLNVLPRGHLLGQHQLCSGKEVDVHPGANGLFARPHAAAGAVAKDVLLILELLLGAAERIVRLHQTDAFLL